jgi:4-hydroxybenzoate decarboxylase
MRPPTANSRAPGQPHRAWKADVIPRDLRSFLERLEHEGQLVHYREELLPEPDVRALMRGAADIGPAAPAVMLHNIKGYRGKRLVVNVHGSWANHALMLGMPKTAGIKEQFHELEERWDRYPGELVWVDEPACREVVLEKDFNLLELLPLCRINEHDGGFYLAKAAVVSNDLEYPGDLDTENVGIYRIQVLDADTLAMQGLAFHDVAVHIRKAEQRGLPLPIAVCLGVDPMLSFVASTPLAYDKSEYKYSAALNGIPLELCKTADGSLNVPARAEFVLEGEVVPGVRVPEGPFGEFTGGYSGARRQVMIRVKRVTHRLDPILENLYIGRSWSECDTLMALNTSVPLYRQIRETMPEVKAVNAMYQHGLTVIIATASRLGGYGKSVAFRAASTPHGIANIKNIIVVDEDVDPFDLNQVMWAMSTRIRGPEDVIVVPGTPGHPLDPSSEPAGMSCKVILDCTTPVPPDTLLRDVRKIGEIEGAASFGQLLAELQRAAGGSDETPSGRSRRAKGRPAE